MQDCLPYLLREAGCGKYCRRVLRSQAKRSEDKEGFTMLILLIVLLLVLGGGGGYYGHSRWGYGGGAGIGLGTILLILLVAFMVGGIHL